MSLRKLATWICVAVILPGSAAGQPGPADLVLDAPEGPFAIRLHVEYDGQPLAVAHRAAQTRFLKALFAYLDRNGDGTLDEKEARWVPAPRFSLEGLDSQDVHVAYNFRALDADGDGRATADELAGYFNDLEGDPLHVINEPPLPALSFRLAAVVFERLDRDGDRKLSPAERAAAPAVLAGLDRNEDELLTPDEVDPPLAAPGQPVAVNVTVRAAPALRRTSAGAPVPHVELRIRLGTPGGPVEVLRPEEKAPRPGRTEDRVILILKGVRLEIRRDRSAFRTSHGEALAIGFRAGVRSADIDSDGVVSTAEGRRSIFLRERFEMLDRDGDGKLTTREVDDWLAVMALQATAMASSSSVAATPRGTGLWDLLDRNHDGALGPREQRSADELLTTLDTDRDGFVSPEEIVPSDVLQIGPGETHPGRQGEGDVVVLTDRGRLEYAPPGQGSGPLWFRRMDRNGDGDVSRREFLGPPDVFHQLDRDGDGLIDRREAESAKPPAQRPAPR